MKPIKGVLEFKVLLQSFEQEVCNAIALQLKRLDRPVEIDELPAFPFYDNLQPHIAGFFLDPEDHVMVTTTMDRVGVKGLKVFVADRLMSCDHLLDLLDMLSKLFDAKGHQGSFLTPVFNEVIDYEGTDELCWVCKCGNSPDSDGFYTCDKDGNLIEATTNSVWDNLYRCACCGRVLDQRDRRVLGINLNPNEEKTDE